MQQLILLLHILICVSLVVLVLLQHGKGADIGAAFGSGASQTVFGSSGSGSFLLKITGTLAALFFLTSITLSYLVAHETKRAQFALPTSQQKPLVNPGQKKAGVTPVPVKKQ